MTEEQRQIAMDFQNLFASDLGKRVLFHIKNYSGYEKSIDARNETQGTILTWIGNREMYLFIQDQMEADTTLPEHQVKASGIPGVNEKGQQPTQAETELSD